MDREKMSEPREIIDKLRVTADLIPSTAAPELICEKELLKAAAKKIADQQRTLRGNANKLNLYAMWVADLQAEIDDLFKMR